MRRLFVIVHEPRVASHVGGQYRRQPTLDPAWRLLRHGVQIQPIGYCTTDQTRVQKWFDACRLLAVRPEGANHQWRKIPPKEFSIYLVPYNWPRPPTPKALPPLP